MDKHYYKAAKDSIIGKICQDWYGFNSNQYENQKAIQETFGAEGMLRDANGNGLSGLINPKITEGLIEKKRLVENDAGEYVTVKAWVPNPRTKAGKAVAARFVAPNVILKSMGAFSDSIKASYYGDGKIRFATVFKTMNDDFALTIPVNKHKPWEAPEGCERISDIEYERLFNERGFK